MAPKQQRKNIVLISMDDSVAFWKYKSIFGETLQTPNLDRICGQSTAFHAAYCQAPVCSPSRASFMSGLSPHQNGVKGPEKLYFKTMSPTQMWPYLMKKGGYFCSTGGKVMQGYRPLDDDLHATLYSDPPQKLRMGPRFAINDTENTSKGIPRKAMGGFRHGWATTDPQDDNAYYDHNVLVSLSRFLGNYEGDQPFYREVGFMAPHGPWVTPQRFKDMYSLRNIHPPKDWENGFEETDFLRNVTLPNIDSSQLRYWKKSVRNYFSALSFADYSVGRAWDSIKRSPHAENTVIVITTDHGLHLGERSLFRKHTLWEQVANVPLIIHDPDRPVAQVVTDPVGLIDLGPTVLDYAGLPPIEGSMGRSLRPQMDWQTVPDRAVPTFFLENAAIRKGKYRFIRYEDGRTEFFDLSQDWWQTRDLGSEHPEYADMAAAHKACCAEYGMDVSGF